MKKIEGGSLLARADKGSKHGASSQGALEQIAFEPFVQQVGDAHGQDPEKVVHLFFAESMKFPSEFQKFCEVEMIRIGFVGERCLIESREKFRKSLKQLAKSLEPICVGFRVSGDLLRGVRELPRG
jgi:hypothetical protein